MATPAKKLHDLNVVKCDEAEHPTSASTPKRIALTPARRDEILDNIAIAVSSMSMAEDVVYLDLRDVLKAHSRLFGITPEQAADHVRNMDGLLSVLSRPRQYAYYEEADLALQAAVLSHGIAEGLLFVDGNKRTAAFVLLGFLQFNGFTLNCDEMTLAVWIFCLSKGETVEDLAEQVRGALVPFEP